MSPTAAARMRASSSVMKSPAGGGRGVGCYAFSAILSLLAGTVHFPS